MKELFSAKFNEPQFRNFVTRLLPDFQADRRPIVVKGVLKTARLLGTSEACNLSVLLVRVDDTRTDRRTEITQATFRVLRQHRIRNALVAFYNNKDEWRLSLLTSKLEIQDGKIISKNSDPRRYSYLLGPKAKTKTPKKYLIEQGKVANLEELKARFSVEVVNKQFYKAIQTQFIKLISGHVASEKDIMYFAMPNVQPSQAAEFAVRLIGRIIFCWFLKEKHSAAGLNLMPESLMSSNSVRRHPEYYHNILEKIFFQCLNAKFKQREDQFRRPPFDQIPYINGGLFNPQPEDFYQSKNSIKIADIWFIELYEILERYNFTVDENTATDIDLSIDPEMLGRIFENLLAEINPHTKESARKATGSFYTPREIVGYMVDETLKTFLWQETNIEMERLSCLLTYDIETPSFTDSEREKIIDALSRLRVLDPACGSGAFPIGMLQKIFHILKRIDPDGASWYKKQINQPNTDDIILNLRAKFKDKNYDYIRKLGIIKQSIFGVDIQPIATEIAKLRCFLTLMIEEKVDDRKPNRGIHPLPNLDFKFVTANTLKFLPENPNDPFNMFETGSSVELVKKVRKDYFMADKTGRAFLKSEFSNAQACLSRTNQEIARDRYNNLARWRPFTNQPTAWFDSVWMFGLKDFDIVIGNPPYGATLTLQEQKYYHAHYDCAHPKDGSKGILDTFALFIERGLGMLKTGGILNYVVPMSITSNDTIVALQNELEQKCATLKIASFANRPRQIFENACVRTSIISCAKTNTPIQKLYMTKPVRRRRDMSIQEVIDGLEFVEAYKYKLYGRYPKVGNLHETGILEKIFQAKKRVQDYADPKSKGKFYYRAAGGRYFNIITLNPIGTSAEREYCSTHAKLIAACLSTSLFWFYQQVYTDGFNLKNYEINNFPVPDFDKVDPGVLSRVEKLYLTYIDEIENNANLKNVAKDSRYNTQQFKEYKLAKSKKIIDELDDLIDSLYGLALDQIKYIKEYEEAVRIGSNE